MALTPEQLTWLSRDNIRTILVEVEYNVDTFSIYCNNDNAFTACIDPDPCQPFAIFCNNGNTNPNYAKIYCNTTAIQSANAALYTANMPYITDGTSFTDVAGNTVDNIAYVDVLDNIPSINSSIDGSTSLGNIQILNTLGEYDFLFDRDNYALEGHAIKVLVGDPLWTRDKFISVFQGIIDEVTTSNTNTVNISIRDRKDVFNKKNLFKTITEGYVSNLISSATQFTNELINFPRSGQEIDPIPLDYDPNTISVPDGVENTPVPTTLGKCYNISPILIDAWNHVYLVHDGPITDVTAVRSNGVLLDGTSPPGEGLQYEVDAGIGCIRLLNHANATKITCDVVGTTTRGKGYNDTEPLTAHTVPWLIEWIILEHTELTSSDIDYTSFNPTPAIDEFAYEVGIHFTDDQDSSSLLSFVTNSVGAFYRFNRDNKVQLTILEDPDTLATPTITIDQDSIVRNGVSIQGIELPNTEISLGYLKNWTVISESEQAGILNEIESLETQQQLANEYTIIKQFNASGNIKARYPLAEASDLIETLIYDDPDNPVDATAELTRRALIRSELRHIFKVNSVLNPMELSVGDAVTLKHDRFDLTAGKPMIILSMSEKLSSNRVDLELWR